MNSTLKWPHGHFFPIMLYVISLPLPFPTNKPIPLSVPLFVLFFYSFPVLPLLPSFPFSSPRLQPAVHPGRDRPLRIRLQWQKPLAPPPAPRPPVLNHDPAVRPTRFLLLCIKMMQQRDVWPLNMEPVTESPLLHLV